MRSPGSRRRHRRRGDLGLADVDPDRDVGPLPRQPDRQRARAEVVEPHPVQQSPVRGQPEQAGPGLPGCGCAVTVPTSAYPKPSAPTPTRPCRPCRTRRRARAAPGIERRTPCWPARDRSGPATGATLAAPGEGCDPAQQREDQPVHAFGRQGEQEASQQAVHPMAGHSSGWSGRRLSTRVFLRRRRTRRLPSVYSRTRVNSQPRYSASMDSRIDALSRVTSGGSRNGTHS